MVVHKAVKEAGLSEARARAILEAGPEAFVEDEAEKKEEVKVRREGGSEEGNH